MKKNIEKLSLVQNLRITMEITSIEDLLSSAFSIAVKSGALFFAFGFLTVVVSQFFGGVTPSLLELFPNGYKFFSQVDRNFGGTNTIPLLSMFLPITIILIYFQLRIFENHLDNLLGRNEQGNFNSKLTLYWRVLSVVAVPFVCSEMFTLRYTFLGIFNSHLGNIGILLPLLQVVVTSLSIGFIYRCFSRGAFSWESSLVAGAISGILFEIVKYITIYMIRKKMASSLMSDYIVIIVILAVWFFVGALIYAFCARLAYYYEYRNIYIEKNLSILKNSGRRSAREIGLTCLLEMTKRFYSNNEKICFEKVGMNLNEICEMLIITPEKARKVISHLNKVCLVRVLKDKDEEVIVINFSPESLSLEEFIFRIEEKEFGIDVFELPNCAANNWFWQEYRDIVKKSFSNMNLKDLYKMKYHGKSCSH